MRFKHEHVEKPRIDYHAQPTPTYEDFETVTITVGIHGTGTRIEADMPAEKAREWASEIVRACEIVEAEQRAASRDLRRGDTVSPPANHPQTRDAE